jgi:FMN reductase [NAD(P)H]
MDRAGPRVHRGHRRLLQNRSGAKKAGGVAVFQRSLEAIVAAVSDAGIAMATLMIAARALRLGVGPIGGIRSNPQAMIDLIQLPLSTFPADGVVLGYVAEEAPQKPRMAIDGFRHEETYHPKCSSRRLTPMTEPSRTIGRRLGAPTGCLGQRTWHSITAGFPG